MFQAFNLKKYIYSVSTWAVPNMVVLNTRQSQLQLLIFPYISLVGFHVKLWHAKPHISVSIYSKLHRCVTGLEVLSVRDWTKVQESPSQATVWWLMHSYNVDLPVYWSCAFCIVFYWLWHITSQSHLIGSLNHLSTLVYSPARPYIIWAYLRVSGPFLRIKGDICSYTHNTSVLVNTIL